MSFETDTYEKNFAEVTLPNGKRGILDDQGYALEDIGAGYWVEWFEGRRVAVVDSQMKNLPNELADKIITQLEAAA